MPKGNMSTVCMQPRTYSMQTRLTKAHFPDRWWNTALALPCQSDILESPDASSLGGSVCQEGKNGTSPVISKLYFMKQALKQVINGNILKCF